MLLCVLCAHQASVHAQAPSPGEQLAVLRALVERARFEDADAQARALLARTDLSARQRNDGLELLAIAQIARRDEAGAQATLGELFARDPEHPERLRDPGPSVEAVFARARAAARPALTAAITGTAVVSDVHGHALVQVSLGLGRDAIDTVHVFARFASEPEASHVVADVGVRETLAIALPLPLAALPAGSDADKLELYLEARAPSGAVIGRDGSAEAPLSVRLSRTPACALQPAPGRLRGRWWLWTSVAIAIAGVSVGGALAAR